MSGPAAGGDYRAAFYAAYASTHTVHRKGALTPERLRARDPEWRAHVAPFLPADRGARILDVGCGDGVLLWWLQREGYAAAEGVEVSGEQVAIARGLGVEHVHLAPLQEFLRGAPERYDLLILRNVLEHFRKDEALAILADARRALRPGGHVLLQVPNGQSPFGGRIRYGDFTHEAAYAPSALAQVLTVSGFAEPRFHPVRPVFGGRLAALRGLRWALVERLYRFLLASEVGPGRHIVTLDILAHARRD